MKTISDYTIYCTEEQTKKALELGASIELASIIDIKNERFATIGKEYYCTPTAEQIIGWLEEQGILIDIDPEWNKYVSVYVWDCENKSLINNVFRGSRKGATIVAIDTALDYLTQNKK